MKTTLELQRIQPGLNEKLILENLHTLENIWNISVDTELNSVSFEYMTQSDLVLVNKELHELGHRIINDTHQFNMPNNH